MTYRKNNLFALKKKIVYLFCVRRIHSIDNSRQRLYHMLYKECKNIKVAVEVTFCTLEILLSTNTNIAISDIFLSTVSMTMKAAKQRRGSNAAILCLSVRFLCIGIVRRFSFLAKLEFTFTVY